MGVEIERKFLVINEDWRVQATANTELVQAYLAIEGAVSVRVRISDGERARLTLKAGDVGRVRSEFEYDIPLVDARELVELARPFTIEKTRYQVPIGEHVWEVDVFSGRHQGLVIAEIELCNAAESFAVPPWLGREVTEDAAYYNSTLAGVEQD